MHQAHTTGALASAVQIGLRSACTNCTSHSKGAQASGKFADVSVVDGDGGWSSPGCPRAPVARPRRATGPLSIRAQSHALPNPFARPEAATLATPMDAAGRQRPGQAARDGQAQRGIGHAAESIGALIVGEQLLHNVQIEPPLEPSTCMYESNMVVQRSQDSGATLGRWACPGEIRRGSSSSTCLFACLCPGSPERARDPSSSGWATQCSAERARLDPCHLNPSYPATNQASTPGAADCRSSRTAAQLYRQKNAPPQRMAGSSAMRRARPGLRSIEQGCLPPRRGLGAQSRHAPGGRRDESST